MNQPEHTFILLIKLPGKRTRLPNCTTVPGLVLDPFPDLLFPLFYLLEICLIECNIPYINNMTYNIYRDKINHVVTSLIHVRDIVSLYTVQCSIDLLVYILGYMNIYSFMVWSHVRNDINLKHIYLCAIIHGLKNT